MIGAYSDMADKSLRQCTLQTKLDMAMFPGIYDTISCSVIRQVDRIQMSKSSL